MKQYKGCSKLKWSGLATEAVKLPNMNYYAKLKTKSSLCTGYNSYLFIALKYIKPRNCFTIIIHVESSNGISP